MRSGSSTTKRCYTLRELRFILLSAVLAVNFAHSAEPAQSGNLFINGDMEADADSNGVPDGWHSNPFRKLGTGEGRDGGKALTITGVDMPRVTMDGR